MLRYNINIIKHQSCCLLDHTGIYVCNVLCTVLWSLTSARHSVHVSLIQQTVSLVSTINKGSVRLVTRTLTQLSQTEIPPVHPVGGVKSLHQEATSARVSKFRNVSYSGGVSVMLQDSPEDIVTDADSD